MKAIMFPGQGSQYKGMGRSLFSRYPQYTQKANDVLGYAIDELCLSDRDNRLNQTEYTQPALYVVNALSFFDRYPDIYDSYDFSDINIATAKSGSPKSDKIYLGHSLGEYNALLAAGAFDFSTGLRLVKKRGELMASAGAGAMSAILGADIKKIEDLLEAHQLDGIDFANINTPKQVVLSGNKNDICYAEKIFDSQNIRSVRLKVSSAFHSRYMVSAQQAFEDFLKDYQFHPLSATVLANATAKPYVTGEVGQILASQISNPVHWVGSVRKAIEMGCREFDEIVGTTLSKMVGEIRESSIAEKAASANVAALKASGDSAGLPISILGNKAFCRDHNLRSAYVAGGMYRGIASEAMVVRLAKAGMLSFFGTGGLSLSSIQEHLLSIIDQLPEGQSFGANLLCNLIQPEIEMKTVELFLGLGIKRIEAAAFMTVTPALVLFRLRGLSRDAQGDTQCDNHILAKISRPEVAETFMEPAPERIVKKLLEQGKVTAEQAKLATSVPMSHDICVEADSAGHTDMGIPTVLYPSIVCTSRRVQREYNYKTALRVGQGGGIGTPQAAATAFIMGADFILTGSINQCTVEAGISDSAKNLLQDIDVQDTDYAPAGDMFELGVKVQVLKKGVLFPARANKLYQLYIQYDCLEDIPTKVRHQLEDKYFGKSLELVWQETCEYFVSNGRQKEIDRAFSKPKYKMALVFRSYFGHSMRMAMQGNEEQRVNYQIHTGPALGAFNQWVKGSALEDWRYRHVDQIASKLMDETEALLRYQAQEMGFYAKKN
ncbi:MAG: malonyl CoA-ACP transacylase [Alteromonadaceae bacterium]|nr:MAG: malonyl CoA-ACP transacylase [Alteromonadaceae bacterium]